MKEIINKKLLKNIFFQKRILLNSIFQIFNFVCVVTFFCIFCALFYSLISHGVHSFNLNLFIQNPPPPGMDGGGLKNAIVGSLIMVLLGIIIAFPFALLSATYLADKTKKSKLKHVIRTANDVILGAPSILMGLFIYLVFVKTMGNYSGWAGAVALALIAYPIMTKTTEDILNLSSKELKESAFALGIPTWKVTTCLLWKQARPGIITGVFLAMARILGETAPLLFTSLNNSYFSLNLSKPMASLPVTIYQFAMSPYENWQNLAWAAALFITIFSILINIFFRTIFRNRKK